MPAATPAKPAAVTELPEPAAEPVKVVPPAQEKPARKAIKPTQPAKPAKPAVKPVVVPPPPPVSLEALEQGVHQPLGDGEWLYKVRQDDTLLSLANRYYGDYNRWREIYILNEDRLGRGGTLRPGQLLRMPKGAKKTATKSAAGPPKSSGGTR
jgi:nucleoid-associated protein YgaU